MFLYSVKPSKVLVGTIQHSIVNESHVRLSWESPVPAYYRALIPNLIIQYTIQGNYSFTLDKQQVGQMVQLEREGTEASPSNKSAWVRVASIAHVQEPVVC